MPDDAEQLLALPSAHAAIAYTAAVQAAFPDSLPFVVVVFDPDGMTLAADACGFDSAERVAWVMVEAAAHVTGTDPLHTYDA